MGTEILRPQDILTDRMRLNLNPPVVSRRKAAAAAYYTGSGNSNPKSNRRSVRRFSHNEPAKVMEQVTILKRGEPARKTTGDMSLGDMVPRRIRVVDPKPEQQVEEIYAGSAFFTSPSPRALPLPTFSRKKEVLTMVVDDSATKDLRRLLGLE